MAKREQRCGSVEILERHMCRSEIVASHKQNGLEDTEVVGGDVRCLGESFSRFAIVLIWDVSSRTNWRIRRGVAPFAPEDFWKSQIPGKSERQ
jgi:hypothetical protein